MSEHDKYFLADDEPVEALRRFPDWRDSLDVVGRAVANYVPSGSPDLHEKAGLSAGFMGWLAGRLEPAVSRLDSKFGA